jgi:ribosomal protein S18 acetylase RimI-like enzyme
MTAQIEELSAGDLAREIDAFAALLHACVHAGASIGFIQPFSLDEARSFWRDKIAPGLAAGTRRLLVARQNRMVAGTVQLGFDTMPNQRHRGDVSKLMVHPEARRNGIARRLMIELEQIARQEGRTLLTLDTREQDEAEPLYRSLGYRVAGVIPRYARAPAVDRLEGTVVMFKEMAPS